KKQFEVEVFEAIYEKEYIVFTRYEDFKKYLTRNNIVNSSLRNFDYIKNRRLQNILNFLEAHIRSYFYTYNEGLKYGIINDTIDLIEWRRKGYENDCKKWFAEINYDCEQYGIKYLFSYSDIEQYCEEYLAY
ncbi:20249_t:CDS:1, partial [Dentiscutata erythropus]